MCIYMHTCMVCSCFNVYIFIIRRDCIHTYMHTYIHRHMRWKLCQRLLHQSRAREGQARAGVNPPAARRPGGSRGFLTAVCMGSLSSCYPLCSSRYEEERRCARPPLLSIYPFIYVCMYTYIYIYIYIYIIVVVLNYTYARI